MAVSRMSRVSLAVLLAVVLAALVIGFLAPRCPRVTVPDKEAILREDLFTLRECIRRYHQEREAYPASLDVLVSEHHIRRLPIDPFTRSGQSWRAVREPGSLLVIDVRSSSSGTALDGTRYENW